MVRSAPAACRGKARDWSRIAHVVNEVPTRRLQGSRVQAGLSHDWWVGSGPELLSENESLVKIAGRVLELLRHSNGRQRLSTHYA